MASNTSGVQGADVRGRALAAEIHEQLAGMTVKRAGMTAKCDELEAKFALCEIWFDSGYGPAPDEWTDEMWAWYLNERSAGAASVA